MLKECVDECVVRIRVSKGVDEEITEREKG